MPEALLWRRLRGRQVEGAKFRRQYAIGRYFLDFYYPEKRLAIEVDGGQHFEDANATRDEARTKFLTARGVRVLRFTNTDVLGQIDAVLEAILLAINAGAVEPGSS